MNENNNLLELMEKGEEIVLGEGCAVKFGDWKIIVLSWGQELVIDLKTYRVQIRRG